MSASAIHKEMSRFDTRLPKEQKLFLERAAQLAGFSSLSAFVLQTAQEKAKEIIRENEMILASERDSEIFFNALMNPVEPNESLKRAAAKYKSLAK